MRCLNGIPHALSQHINKKRFRFSLVHQKSGKFQSTTKERRECLRVIVSFLICCTGIPEPLMQINRSSRFFVFVTEERKRFATN